MHIEMAERLNGYVRHTFAVAVKRSSAEGRVNLTTTRNTLDKEFGGITWTAYLDH